MQGNQQEPMVIVRPSIPEWEERPQDYKDLLAALKAKGVNARFADHGGIPSGSDISGFVPEAFAVFVATKVTDALIGSLVDDILRIIVQRAKSKWWSRKGRARGVIYGPNGEVVREFILEATDRQG